MKTLIYILIATISFSLAAQRSKTTYNRIGLQGQFAFVNLETSNFETKQGIGFLAGFSTRGAFYNDFDLIYGIDFMQTSIAVVAKDQLNPSFANQEVSYTTTGAQLKLLGSYLIAGEHLTVELGPVLQVNSALKLDNESQKDFILKGYSTLIAGDIQEVSRVNGFLIGGFSAGFDWVRYVARYQYGLTNALSKLNKENLGIKDPAATNFKGNFSLITAGIVFYL